MINKISFKTKFGWISAYANKNKITRIKFGKTNTTTETMSLNKLKCTLKQKNEKATKPQFLWLPLYSVSKYL